MRRVGAPQLPNYSTTGCPFCTVYFMPLDVGSGRPETAVFLLGPLDGQEQPIAGDTDELSVVMSDGQQHRYVRTDELCRLPGGRSGVVFEWTGRYYGPK